MKVLSLSIIRGLLIGFTIGIIVPNTLNAIILIVVTASIIVLTEEIIIKRIKEKQDGRN